MSASGPAHSVTARSQWGLAAVGAIGIAVAGGLAGYAHTHPGNGAVITTFGFSTMLTMKVWLTTAATVLVMVQVITALAMWGRLPGLTHAPTSTAALHRWSGTVAFVLTLPVVFHCVWSLGFSTRSSRTLIHSVAGCLFYGAFASKMLALRLHRLPGWAVPVLGGLLAALLTVVWFSAAFWYFTQPGVPLR